MLILIAESKTMTACDGSVSEIKYESHRPEFEEYAGRIMDSLRGSPPDRLVEELGISAAYSRKLSRMIYEFPNKSLGAEAIEAFTEVESRHWNTNRLRTLKSRGSRVICA